MLGYFRAEIPGSHRLPPGRHRPADHPHRRLPCHGPDRAGHRLDAHPGHRPVVRLLRQIARVQGRQERPRRPGQRPPRRPLVLAGHAKRHSSNWPRWPRPTNSPAWPTMSSSSDLSVGLLPKPSVTTAPLSLIAIDIDFFKAINDTWGHQTGDEVLKQTARSAGHRLPTGGPPPPASAATSSVSSCRRPRTTPAKWPNASARHRRRVVKIGSAKVGLSLLRRGGHGRRAAKVPTPSCHWPTGGNHRSKRGERSQVSQAYRPGRRAAGPETATGLASLTKKVVGVDNRFANVFWAAWKRSWASWPGTDPLQGQPLPPRPPLRSPDRAGDGAFRAPHRPAGRGRHAARHRHDGPARPRAPVPRRPWTPNRPRSSASTRCSRQDHGRPGSSWSRRSGRAAYPSRAFRRLGLSRRHTRPGHPADGPDSGGGRLVRRGHLSARVPRRPGAGRGAPRSKRAARNLTRWWWRHSWRRPAGWAVS